MPAKRARPTSDDPLGLSDVNVDLSEFANRSTVHQPDHPESQPVNPTDDPTTLQEENPSTSRQADTTTPRVSPDRGSEIPAPSKSIPRKSTRQQVSKSYGQPESHPTGQPVTLQKATFQIEATVLDRLEKSTLTLQLQLGKKNAPYKEVIVEEAISRLLEQLQKEETETLEALSQRQARRKES
jgi:hypothetical protein